MLLNRIWYDLRTFLFGTKVDDELRNEIAYHLEREKERNLARGFDAVEAQRLAALALGGATLTLEQSRDVSGFSRIEAILSDLRYSARTLLKRRGFSAAVIATLGMGIGVAATVFTVVNAVVLRDLPFDRPDQLVAVWERDERSTQVGADREEIAPANLDDWQRESRTFAGFAAYTVGPSELTGGAEAEEVTAAAISPSLFSLLGVTVFAGRAFRADDGEPTADRVVLLSENLWRRRFGSDTTLINRSIEIGGVGHRVIGIVPLGSEFPRTAELWTPRRPDAAQLTQRSAHFLQVVGRLRADVSVHEAQSELSTIAAQLSKQYPKSNAGRGVRVTDLQKDQNGSMRETLLMLFGAVGCVLLIACANVGGLFLARSASRESEMALRTALGASRGRVLQQLLVESLLLSCCGAALGLVLAVWGTRAVIVASPVAVVPASGAVNVDSYVVIFAMFLSIATAVAFAAFSAIGISTGRLIDGLRSGNRQSLARSGQTRGRRILVTAEVALTMILLAGAGLMLRTLTQLHLVDLGFAPEHLLMTSVQLPGSRYPAGSGRADRAIARIITEVRAIDGVRSAAAVFMLPFSRDNRIYGFRKGEELEKTERANFRVATPDYFATMQVPLRKGRDFSAIDTAGSTPVVIINETMAQRYWPTDDSPIGHRIFIRGQTTAAEVIGVVKDVKYFGLDSPAEPEMYVPHAQVQMNGMTIVLRTTEDPMTIAGLVGTAVHAIDPNLPLRQVKAMTELVDDSLAVRRFARLLLAGFASLALVLSCIGLYGLVAYSVAQRTTEIGIRMALGARPADVLTLVASEGLSIALVGTLFGVAGAALLGHVLSRFIFGISPSDPLVLLAAAFGLACVSIIASLIPAMRATRLMPATVLRST